MAWDDSYWTDARFVAAPSSPTCPRASKGRGHRGVERSAKWWARWPQYDINMTNSYLILNDWSNYDYSDYSIYYGMTLWWMITIMIMRFISISCHASYTKASEAPTKAGNWAQLCTGLLVVSTGNRNGDSRISWNHARPRPSMVPSRVPFSRRMRVILAQFCPMLSTKQGVPKSKIAHDTP